MSVPAWATSSESTGSVLLVAGAGFGFVIGLGMGILLMFWLTALTG